MWCDKRCERLFCRIIAPVDILPLLRGHVGGGKMRTKGKRLAQIELVKEVGFSSTMSEAKGSNQEMQSPKHWSAPWIPDSGPEPSLSPPVALRPLLVWVRLHMRILHDNLQLQLSESQDC